MLQLRERLERHRVAVIYCKDDYGTWVPSDCVASETPQAKATALKSMKTVLKCDVRSSVSRAGK